MLSKSEIRNRMLARRAELTEEIVEKSGNRLVKELEILTRAQSVCTEVAFIYISAKQEVSTIPLISHYLQNGSRVLVPRTLGKGHMEAVEITDPEADLAPGRFGIPEPVSGLPSWEGAITLTVVPGVAFDRQGNRIGYGGGYYDRFFSRVSGTEALYKVGVCYDFQLQERIPSQETDIAMDCVLAIPSVKL